MKTNYQMLMELLEKYEPKQKGFMIPSERELIITTLCLDEMDILALHNLRDFVVADMCRSDDVKDWDRMSAITYCIDSKIINLGGEV